MTEINHKNPIGQIQIADDVIAMIAGAAALEIDGIAGMAGNFADITEILGRRNLGKGVKVEVTDGTVHIGINIIVRFGYQIHEVSSHVQQRVKNAVESMTGLSVAETNIYVTGLQAERDRPKDPAVPYE